MKLTEEMQAKLSAHGDLHNKWLGDLIAANLDPEATMVGLYFGLIDVLSMILLLDPKSLGQNMDVMGFDAIQKNLDSLEVDVNIRELLTITGEDTDGEQRAEGSQDGHDRHDSVEGSDRTEG